MRYLEEFLYDFAIIVFQNMKYSFEPRKDIEKRIGGREASYPLYRLRQLGLIEKKKVKGQKYCVYRVREGWQDRAYELAAKHEQEALALRHARSARMSGILKGDKSCVDIERYYARLKRLPDYSALAHKNSPCRYSLGTPLC